MVLLSTQRVLCVTLCATVPAEKRRSKHSFNVNSNRRYAQRSTTHPNELLYCALLCIRSFVRVPVLVSIFRCCSLFPNIYILFFSHSFKCSLRHIHARTVTTFRPFPISNFLGKKVLLAFSSLQVIFSCFALTKTDTDRPFGRCASKMVRVAVVIRQQRRHLLCVLFNATSLSFSQQKKRGRRFSFTLVHLTATVCCCCRCRFWLFVVECAFFLHRLSVWVCALCVCHPRFVFIWFYFILSLVLSGRSREKVVVCSCWVYVCVRCSSPIARNDDELLFVSTVSFTSFCTFSVRPLSVPFILKLDGVVRCQFKWLILVRCSQRINVCWLSVCRSVRLGLACEWMKAMWKLESSFGGLPMASSVCVYVWP